MADTKSDGYREPSGPRNATEERQTNAGCKLHWELQVGPDGPGGPMADTSSGLVQEQGRRQEGRDGIGPAIEVLAVPDSSGAGLSKRNGGGSDNEPLQQAIRTHLASYDRTLFPPGPADRDAWREIIKDRPDLAPAVEYEVCSVADGIARGVDFTRPDQLRGLGNMVVPLSGALALLILLNRDTER
jgi:hypothetical protein